MACFFLISNKFPKGNFGAGPLKPFLSSLNFIFRGEKQRIMEIIRLHMRKRIMDPMT